MKKRRRGTVDIFNLSFLDVVSCGFGAIILLLVIVKVSEPFVLEQSHTDLSGLVRELEEQLREVRGEREILNRELTTRQEQLSESKEKLARLQGELFRIQGRHEASRLDMEAQTVIEQQMALARQKLSAEQKRLLGSAYRRSKEDATIGGVPVDSEYIIFIIDTSGSMQKFAWPLVRRKMAEVLKVYPRVKGIQVLNDMGEYMFSQYKGRWISDTPVRRKAILKRLSSWAPFSNSSPVEGVEAAIRRFYSPDKKISLYIFGDDFSRGSIDSVVRTVSKLNSRGSSGRRRVRIHAVGFPVLFQNAPNYASAARFAALMRRLAETNNGSFVGLNDSRR
ncbi:MAG: VWA domain-containing protein [Gammaproteobacteria bacterium]|nr:VWA domain-containing protein [Gammaproteobacteria bacterium]